MGFDMKTDIYAYKKDRATHGGVKHSLCFISASWQLSIHTINICNGVLKVFIDKGVVIDCNS